MVTDTGLPGTLILRSTLSVHPALVLLLEFFIFLLFLVSFSLEILRRLCLPGSRSLPPCF
uniref:Uncharacterized protein n=1 Tax=Anguilla anguilla TaxID=7936 RepID=A0A0E9WHG3_ANGAN